MSDIHPLSGSSYPDMAQSNPMDVNNHPDTIMPDQELAAAYADASGQYSKTGVPGGMSTLRRDMGTTSGNFMSAIQKDDSLSISKKFRK